MWFSGQSAVPYFAFQLPFVLDVSSITIALCCHLLVLGCKSQAAGQRWLFLVLVLPSVWDAVNLFPLTSFKLFKVIFYFPSPKPDLSSCERDFMPPKLNDLLSSHLQRKIVDPCSKQYRNSKCREQPKPSGMMKSTQRRNKYEEAALLQSRVRPYWRGCGCDSATCQRNQMEIE